MSDELRERLAQYAHRCEHGSLRAQSQFTSYAGPVYTCSCCRGVFGSLASSTDPVLCPVCRFGPDGQNRGLELSDFHPVDGHLRTCEQRDTCTCVAHLFAVAQDLEARLQDAKWSIGDLIDRVNREGTPS